MSELSNHFPTRLVSNAFSVYVVQATLVVQNPLIESVKCELFCRSLAKRHGANILRFALISDFGYLIEDVNNAIDNA